MKRITIILAAALHALTIHALPNSMEDLMFKHITTSEGLSSNRIHSILHDSHGFLWIGSADGLDRYDAYDFKSYSGQDLEVHATGIGSLFEDPKGNIIIRAYGGYRLYSYADDEFMSDIDKYLKGFGLPQDYTSLGAEERKYIWAVTESEIHVHDSDTDTCVIVQKQQGRLADITIKHNAVYHIYDNARIFMTGLQDGKTIEIHTTEGIKSCLKDNGPRIFIDSEGHLWLHSTFTTHLFRMTQFPDRWDYIQLTDEEGQFNRISAIDEGANGDIWITTTHSGGFIYRRHTGELYNFRHSEFISSSVASDNLYTLHIDDEGAVWIGNYKNGISFWSDKSHAFINFRHGVKFDIQAFCEHDGYIWIGSDGNGLLRKPIDGNDIEEVCNTANVIRNLKTDNKGRLWIGSYRNGLLCYDNGRIRQYSRSTSEIADDDIYGLQIESDGTIWIGTLNGTIQKFESDKNKFSTIFRNEETNIRSLLLDNEEHMLYSATAQGILCTNTSSGLTRQINIEGLSHTVYDMVFDHSGNLWIGGDDGLFIFNPKTDRKHKVNSISVVSIEEDQYGRIWYCDRNSLHCITYQDEQFYSVRYDHTDGLPACTLNEGALFRCSDNRMLLGTSNGLTNIFVKEETAADYNARIELSSIYPIYGSLNEMLNNKSITNADEIRVKEGFPMLMLNFSSFDFHEKGTIFSYRINDSEWTEVNGNTIQLSFLPAGKYDLQVRAGNIQNTYAPNVKHITIKVLDPWYKTWWAYIIYILTILAILYITQHTYKNKQRREMEAQKEKEEARQQSKVAEMKLQFFANISHEFRTPLSLIINPLEEFLSKHPEHKKPLLSTVKNNANYLLELINQLLDFRKLDSGGEVMNYVYGDIIALINDIMISFESIARQKEIDFTLKSPKESIMMDFDYGKIRKVITNLLSNAFKFTSEGGKIEVKAEILDNNIMLNFIDNGQGIEKKDMEKIFNCFYQGDGSGNNQGGSGIGLYLVSEYVKMHKGTLQVASNLPHGAIFTVILPMKVGQTISVKSDISEEQMETCTESDRNYTILIVDDNIDFMNFLGSSLSNEYYILTASNGKKAIDVLRNESPDLIISDVMMPEMDGLQLCTAVKTDIRFSHIPIILLTAKVGEQYQIEGLEHGADDYIAKPFSMEVLKIRISKIISESIARRGLFNNEIQIEPSRITITPLDKQFIQKAISSVEANICDPDFSVERLASDLNISRGYLYKKLMMITGKVPLAFIKEIKMKRALQWLLESQLQISEIAYKIGYSSPRIFTKHFKEVHGITPTEYLKRHKEG